MTYNHNQTIPKDAAHAGNKGFAIAGVLCFADTLVQGGSSVLRTKFSAKTPRHRKPPKRYLPFDKRPLNLKISNKVTKQLGTLIAGDTSTAPYLSGPKLVDFYNECEFDDVYGEGFPSRWKYSTDKIVEANGTNRLRKILEEFVDPRRYGGDNTVVDKIVTDINSLIRFDGYALIKNGNFYKVADTQGNFIQPETLKTVGHEFVAEQIEKCQQKISADDFNGAITNARTLTEAVLIHVIETTELHEIKNDGNILNLWSRAKKSLKIDLKKDEIPDTVFQILSGLDTALNGLAGLSNNAGDRHANKFNTKRHHAKLAVNLSMTICDFLIDILNERQQNGR